MTLFDLHATWAWMVIIGNAMAGSWVLGAKQFPPLRTRAMWWFVAFAEIAVLVQVFLGLLLMVFDHRQAPFFHYFYGIVATIALILLFLYRTRMRKKIFWLYGLGGFFLMGLGIRAMIVVLAS